MSLSFDEYWENAACLPVPGDLMAARYHAEDAWIHSGRPRAYFMTWWESNAALPEPGWEGAKKAALQAWQAAATPQEN